MVLKSEPHFDLICSLDANHKAHKGHKETVVPTTCDVTSGPARCSMPAMRWLLILGTLLVSANANQPATSQGAQAVPRVVVDNPRVRVYRTTADSLARVDHGPAVVVSLEDAPGTNAGNAVWLDDAAALSGTVRM